MALSEVGKIDLRGDGTWANDFQAAWSMALGGRSEQKSQGGGEQLRGQRGNLASGWLPLAALLSGPQRKLIQLLSAESLLPNTGHFLLSALTLPGP